MTYTAYDFMNTEILGKHMRLGWKLELQKNGLIALRYTMLNFDWSSLDFLGDEAWNLFLESKSYANLKKKLATAMNRLGRLYVDAYCLSDLKLFAESARLKVDIDKLIAKKVQKKSSELKAKNELKMLHAD